MKDQPTYDVYGDGAEARNLRRLRETIIKQEENS